MEFDHKVKHERIIDLVSVDMNNIELEHKGAKDYYGNAVEEHNHNRDTNWYDRLFVVTNAGI